MGRAYLLLLFSLVAMLGCSSSEQSPSAAPTAPTLRALIIFNLRPLDSTNEQYVLWLERSGVWMPVVLTRSASPRSDDSTLLTFALPDSIAPASVSYALLSVESLAIPALPTSVVLAGVVNRDSAILSMTDTLGIGDYSKARATATFATTSSDTDRAKQEFYLMRLTKNGVASSIAGLPISKSGWQYALWVVDSSFYPAHLFYYGSFSDPAALAPSGNKSFPFPGGFNPAPLNDAAGEILLTIEPTASLDARPHMPSHFVILTRNLQAYISQGDTLALQNVWSASVMSGALRLQ